ncbi:malonyl-CoA synthase [Defluviimonas sp. 20V17]|uniref:Malonyl-CoA synthase n=1 Tax=Allgaiera indica TaxID=765699 RepID=A0AAN4UNG2_9RHOB|nr:malonyl-CoA synthase [Allgaiera indica]KDB05101.1 malonyl-CoA synthase [Defluviimonas sp. 20V17]GHD99038.1 malonyl-CoA synthase [Allgaiera indica]SDW01492.1 malonyl-CoA/methylmalonyl-CoA synthetase [Allgaiera indica]
MANTLYDALFAPLAGRASPFLILPDGAEVSGDAFHRMIARFAHVLRAQGVVPGDRIAVQVAKTPEALALYGAAVAAGAIFLPLNTGYTPDEVAYFLGNATPRLFVCDGTRAKALAPIAAASGARLETLNADGSGSLTEQAANQPDALTPAERGPDDLAAFLYTSGTTGRSKGAMLSHANLLSNAEVLVDYWRFTDADVLLHALPIFHTHGLFVACNVSLLAGGAMIFLPGFDLDQVIRLLPRATSMMGVPTFYTRLLDDPRFTRDLTRHMRLFTSGSAPMLTETHLAFEARTGQRILERYGMTETNMNTSNPYDGERRPGTVGFPLPGVEVKITDPDTGGALPQGQAGMIEVRGPNVFQGYWQMPEKTAEELRENGFFITGDIGQIDADGYVSIVGRQKDLIISGGYNVYPKEVELILDEQPGVLESAVIGVPHPDFGEAVFAVLTPAGEGPDEGAIRAALGASLAKFKQPKGYAVLPELPRNTMGKVQKALLRTQFAKTFA